MADRELNREELDRRSVMKKAAAGAGLGAAAMAAPSVAGLGPVPKYAGAQSCAPDGTWEEVCIPAAVYGLVGPGTLDGSVTLNVQGTGNGSVIIEAVNAALAGADSSPPNIVLGDTVVGEFEVPGIYFPTSATCCSGEGLPEISALEISPFPDILCTIFDAIDAVVDLATPLADQTVTIELGGVQTFIAPSLCGPIVIVAPLLGPGGAGTNSGGIVNGPCSTAGCDPVEGVPEPQITCEDISVPANFCDATISTEISIFIEVPNPLPAQPPLTTLTFDLDVSGNLTFPCPAVIPVNYESTITCT